MCTAAAHVSGFQSHDPLEYNRWAFMLYFYSDQREGRAPKHHWNEHGKGAAAHWETAGPSTRLPSSDSSQVPSTCSSLPLVFGCSNMTC